MSRKFGIRGSADRFWNDSDQQERDPVWPFVVIALAVAVILGMAFLIQ